MSRSTDTVSWKSRSRENNFVPLARWGVAVRDRINGLYHGHGEHVPGPWLPDGHKKQWRSGNQNVEKLNFLNPIYTRIWSHLTLSTPCAFHDVSWCLCRVCQRKEIKKRWIIVELSFNICHAATL